MFKILDRHNHSFSFFKNKHCHSLYENQIRIFVNYTNKDPYEILGVKRSDSLKAITAKWHELSRKYHPDVNPDKKAHEYLKGINAAYQAIKAEFKKDPDHRTNYDGNATKTEKYTSSSDRKKSEEQEAEARAAQEAFSRHDRRMKLKEEEILFEDIFGFSYKSDPNAYYDPKNAHLRKTYDEELAKLRIKKDRPSDNASTKSKETYGSQGFTAESTNFYSKDAYKETAEEQYKAQNEYTGSHLSKEQDQGVDNKILAGFLVFASLPMLYFISEYEDTKKTFGRANKTLTDEEVENIRVKALKKQEDKRKKKKEEYLNTLALMKMYPKANPNAITMLLEYTIWQDIKLYHVSCDFFYDPPEKVQNNDKFQRYKLIDARLNTMLTLALESERMLKHLHVKVNDVLKSLQEKGYYEPPGAFFRYHGYMYLKMRRKPIIVENLKNAIENDEKYINVFDLFFKYSTPILLANDEYYEIPLRHGHYIPDTTTREGSGWIGNAKINHRPIPNVYANNGEKNVFFWRGNTNRTTAEWRYISAFHNHYDNLLRKYPHFSS